MFLLQFHSFAKKVDAEQGRLAPMPGEADDILRRGLNMLDNITLQCLVVQTEISSLGIEFFLFEVIAVMTVEVADRTDRLYHDLKFARCSFQRITPDLEALYSKKLLMSPPVGLGCEESEAWVLPNPVGYKDIELSWLFGVPG